MQYTIILMYYLYTHLLRNKLHARFRLIQTKMPKKYNYKCASTCIMIAINYITFYTVHAHVIIGL